MTIDAVVERVNEGGNLLANLALIDINTWQTSQEVWRDQQGGAEVEGISTANLAVYRLENDEVVFELLGREGNPFMHEALRTEAYGGIFHNGFFIPQGAMKQYIKSAEPIVTVHYSKLRLKTENCGESYCYVEFDGNNNNEEKRLLNGVYGTNYLDNGRRIYLLRPNVVEYQLRNRKDDLVARACCFGNLQHLLALNRNFGSYTSAVRGVRRVDVAEVRK